MALPGTTRTTSYTGNGATVDFAVPFEFLDSADLVVTVTPSGGSAVTQTEGVDYTVTGAGLGSGGTVTFTTAPASGSTVTIKRTVALTQPTAFTEQGSFSASVHEEAFDRAMMGLQQLDDELATEETTRATADTALDARVSLLEDGASGGVPGTAPHTGTASAIADRTAPTVTRPATGTSWVADEGATAWDALTDSIASLLAHGGLLDVANSWSAANTFSHDLVTNGQSGDTHPARQVTAAPTTRKLVDQWVGTGGVGVGNIRFYSLADKVEITIDAAWDGTQWVSDSGQGVAARYTLAFDASGAIPFLKVEWADGNLLTWADATWATPTATLASGANTTLAGGGTCEVARDAGGVVTATISMSVGAAGVAPGETVATIGTASELWGRPAVGWFGAARRINAGTSSAVPVGIATTGEVIAYTALVSGDTLDISAAFRGA